MPFSFPPKFFLSRPISFLFSPNSFSFPAQFFLLSRPVLSPFQPNFFSSAQFFFLPQPNSSLFPAQFFLLPSLILLHLAPNSFSFPAQFFLLFCPILSPSPPQFFLLPSPVPFYFPPNHLPSFSVQSKFTNLSKSTSCSIFNPPPLFPPPIQPYSPSQSNQAKNHPSQLNQSAAPSRDQSSNLIGCR